MTELKREIFKLLPGCFIIVDAQDPHFTIIDATDAYLALASRGREIIGRPLFEIFPDSILNNNDGLKTLKASFEKVIRTKQRDEWDAQRYDTNAAEGEPFEVHYWKPSNIPVPDNDGTVKYIIHCVEDVTRQTLLRKQLTLQDQKMQQQITDAVTTTQELERMEIGRDLHDNINQLLITARLYLGRAMNTSPLSLSYATSAYELISKAIEEVKNLSLALSATSFEEENLIASLEQLIAHITDDGSVMVEKDFALPDESMIEAKVKVALFRIVQEQFSNIIKHADAKKISIRLGFSNNNLHLRIVDDGKGFTPDRRKQGMGFQNIKSRVAVMDGSVTINSTPGDGCTIEINIPHLAR